MKSNRRQLLRRGLGLLAGVGLGKRAHSSAAPPGLKTDPESGIGNSSGNTSESTEPQPGARVWGRRRPNVLLFLPDQHRHDWLGFGPDALPISTPNIERLARDGAHFRRALVPSPVCAPSRACLAQGLDYERCGVRNNEDQLPSNRVTIYRRLRDSGYHVMAAGKVDLAKSALDWGVDGQNHREAWGFSSMLNSSGKFDGAIAYLNDPVGPKDPYFAYLHGKSPELALRHVEDLSRRGAAGRVSFWTNTEVTPLDDEDYCDNWVARQGLELLEQTPRGRPWFLTVNFVGPHRPMDITQRMSDLVRGPDRRLDELPGPRHYRGSVTAQQHLELRRNYAAMIENIDRWLGIYHDRLRARRELWRTVVIYCSDHGDMLGDLGQWGKTLPYEGSAGVPLCLAGPGIPRRGTVDEPVTTYDLAATLLELAGLTVPGHFDSRSLLPLLRGEPDGARPYLRSGLLSPDGDWRMATDDRYKLVRGFGSKELRLFDLQEDPGEARDLAAELPDRVAEMLPWLEPGPAS